jgi:hypothetical protein
MNEQMKLLVNMLKERIIFNLQIIKKNEENIRKILLQPLSDERTKLLKDSFGFNRKLLEENQESLAIELQLIKYIGKHKEMIWTQTQNSPSTNQSTKQENDFITENIESKNDNDQMEDEDLLNLTLLGEIPFNARHPRFNDEKFTEELLENYKQSENYEMCSHLLKLKGKR